MYQLDCCVKHWKSFGTITLVVARWSAGLTNGRSHGGGDPSPKLSKQLCFRSQGSLAKLEGESGDGDTQLTKMDVVLTFQLEVSYINIIQCFGLSWSPIAVYTAIKSVINVIFSFTFTKSNNGPSWPPVLWIKIKVSWVVNKPSRLMDIKIIVSEKKKQKVGSLRK